MEAERHHVRHRHDGDGRGREVLPVEDAQLAAARVRVEHDHNIGFDHIEIRELHINRSNKDFAGSYIVEIKFKRCSYSQRDALVIECWSGRHGKHSSHDLVAVAIVGERLEILDRQWALGGLKHLVGGCHRAPVQSNE